MKLIPLPASQDNYLWLLHDGHRALVVDRGDAKPVLAALQHHGLQLEAILVTHHGADHMGAPDALRDATGDARTTNDEVGVFAALRQWKNEFR